MGDRLRVYIAGPISKGDLRLNIDQARAAARWLIQAGFAPLTPQLTCYMVGDTPTADGGGFDHAEWMEVDLPWVDVADAVLRLRGHSPGADEEVARAEARGIPVYTDLETLIDHLPGFARRAGRGGDDRPKGDPRFHALLAEMGALHDRKQADYGRGQDPLANVRASAEFGVPPWVGAVLRANDKVHRIKSMIQNGRLENESVEDSLMDVAVYMLLARILRDEERAAAAG